MRSTARSITALIAAGLFVAACAGGGTTPTPAPTLAAATPPIVPTPTPPAMTDGQGPEHFTGITSTAPSLAVNYTEKKVGEVTQMRGGIVSWMFSTTDVRMSGTAGWAFSVDAYGTVGPEWGRLTITNSGGSWSGNCTAASWESGNRLVAGCWLTGGGAYKGFTAYYSLYNTADGTEGIEGVIYPGPAPKV